MHGIIQCWRDHVYQWSHRLVGAREYDNCLQVIQPVPGYWHFNSGVQNLSQLTCCEDRELQQTHVAIIAGSPNVTRKILENLCTFHDFIYLVQYQSHSEDTLRYLNDALSSFNKMKDEYICLGVCKGVNGVINHFKIPKLYTLRIFSPHVRLMGSSPQFSTEVIENNHRHLAKAPYKLTNCQNFAAQMCQRLDCEEHMLYHDELLEWCAKQDRIDAVNDSLAGYSLSS
jgi:hypothetical protein